MSGKSKARMRAKKKWKEERARNDRINQSVNAVVANQDTRSGYFDKVSMNSTKNKSPLKIKSRKKMERELLVLKNKMPNYLDFYDRNDNDCYRYDVTAGRIVALEWVLGLPLNKSKYRTNIMGTIISEMQLAKSVEGQIKTRATIKRKLSILKSKLSTYKKVATNEMYPYERYSAKLHPYAEHPIAHMLIGMIIALEWILRSTYEDTIHKNKKNENIPTVGNQYYREVYTKPRR